MTVEPESSSGPPVQGGSQTIAPGAGRTWSVTTINFWLDALALSAVGLVGWVSTLMVVVFPPPTQADGWVLWGWSFDDWFRIQFGAICTCAIVILVHVMLHWSWVCNVAAVRILRLRRRPDEGSQTIYGVAVLALLLHLILAGVVWAMFAVRRPGS